MLKELKIGDEVVYDPSKFGERVSIKVITKITETMIICDNLRFKKDTGRIVGNKDRWHFPSIKPLTQELRDKILKDNLVDKLKVKNWDYFPLEILKEINEVINKFKVSKETDQFRRF